MARHNTLPQEARMTPQPKSELLEDTISLEAPYIPHPSSEKWYSRDKNRDLEYEEGIRFCDLYQQETRSRREEAELGTAYWIAYQISFDTVALIARKAGLRDSELIADCAAGLVDFCARQYDATSVGRGGRRKTFGAYLKNIAYAYLRKHRDFLAFAKKMTGTGYASQDLMTVATFGDEYARMKRESPSKDDYRDVLDTLDPDSVESLYAAEWSSFADVETEDDEVGQSIDEIEDRLPATLREWIDYLLLQIQHSGMSPAMMSMRVPAILEQLKSATGARVMDIVKRLIARMKTGCQVALEMLRSVRTAIPERHEQTLKLINEALVSIQSLPQGHEVPHDTAGSGTVHQNIQSASTEALVSKEADNDLAFLIEPSDLRHGRVPPAKPRYVTVDAPPVEPSGAPPLLEDPSPPVDEGSPTAQIIALHQRWDTRKVRPWKRRGGLHGYDHTYCVNHSPYMAGVSARRM